MHNAIWYSPENFPDGINGIHEGESGTKYGIPQSHGCTRVPGKHFSKKDTMQKLYQWCDVETPIVIIGDKNKNLRDSDLFDVKDYTSFRTVLDLIKEGKFLKGLEIFEERMLEACKKYYTIPKLGEEFRKAVEGSR